MTSITNWLCVENINLCMRAESELETIAAMLDLASQSAEVKDVKRLAQELLSHEVMMPSPTGCCAVVFQAVSSAVLAPQIFFGRFDHGIGYYSKKGHPIDLIFMIIAPPDREQEFIYVIKSTKQVLQEVSIRERLRAVQSPEETLEVLSRNLVRK